MASDMNLTERAARFDRFRHSLKIGDRSCSDVGLILVKEDLVYTTNWIRPSCVIEISLKLLKVALIRHCLDVERGELSLKLELIALLKVVSDTVKKSRHCAESGTYWNTLAGGRYLVTDYGTGSRAPSGPKNKASG
jgi:hypothetical protein